MKKRRTLIISLLLVAALCMGIGYAELAGELKINGNASVTAADVTLIWSESNAVATAADITTDTRQAEFEGSVDAGDPGESEITIRATGFRDKDDTVVFTLTAQNNGNVPVKLKALKLDGTQELTTANLSAKFGEANIDVEVDGWDEGAILEAGQTTTVIITMTLNATRETTASVDFTLVATGEAVYQ